MGRARHHKAQRQKQREERREQERRAQISEMAETAKLLETARVSISPDRNKKKLDGAERWAAICDAAEKAGMIPPALIYAMRKCGYMVTIKTAPTLTAQELEAWRLAVDEFNAKGKVTP